MSSLHPPPHHGARAHTHTHFLYNFNIVLTSGCFLLSTKEINIQIDR